MNFNALRTELVNDPLSVGYSSMTPEQIQESLTVNTLIVNRHVPLDTLQAMLMSVIPEGSQVPAWWVLKASSTINPIAEMAYDLFNSRLQALDMGLPTVVMLLGQLVSTGVLTQIIADDIIALASVELPRGEALFGVIPTILEIQFALLD